MVKSFRWECTDSIDSVFDDGPAIAYYLDEECSNEQLFGVDHFRAIGCKAVRDDDASVSATCSDDSMFPACCSFVLFCLTPKMSCCYCSLSNAIAVELDLAFYNSSSTCNDATDSKFDSYEVDECLPYTYEGSGQFPFELLGYYAVCDASELDEDDDDGAIGMAGNWMALLTTVVTSIACVMAQLARE